jgi:hypothetical protein
MLESNVCNEAIGVGTASCCGAGPHSILAVTPAQKLCDSDSAPITLNV